MMTRAILILTLSAAFAHAQSARPVPGPLRHFAGPALHDFVTGGTKVTLVPYGATPTARVELVIRSGRAMEDTGKTGVAQLVGEYLLQGSTVRTGQVLSRDIAALGAVGGGLTVSVGTHETLVAGEVLSESAPALIASIAEVALSPAFDSTALDRIKGVVRRRNQITSAADIAATRVNRLLFPGYTADRSPSDTTLGPLTISDLRRFHAQHYVGARTTLYVAGVFDRDAVELAARTAFANAPTGVPVAQPAAAPWRVLSADSVPVVHLIDRPGVAQTRIHIAYPVVDQTHPDHLALNALNSVMGSVQTSRIIANIRERRGYSYNISTRLVRRPGATSWAIQGDVNRDVTGAALREILGEVDRLPTAPPSATELAEFQRFMSGGMIAEMATARGILDYLRFVDLYGADRAYLRGLVSSIHALTPADLLRVHETYLRGDRRAIVLVGNASRIRAQLQGWTRIIE